MEKVANVIEAIGKVSSHNDKLTLLKRYENLPGLKEILRFIYNPYCKTGISEAKLKIAIQDLERGIGDSQRMDWPKALEYFSKNQTGSMQDIAAARDFILYCASNYGHKATKLAMAIVTQNLKIGVTATSLNKAYGADFIPKTGCMLGTLFGDVGEDKVKWPCIVTEKLDGVRRILVKENGVCRFYSRSGHEDTGLVEILAEAKHLPDNFVYDGELLAKGQFVDSIAQRQATNSLANMKGTKTGLTFNIFDMVPVEDFYKGHCGISAFGRKIRLAATFNDDSLALIDEDWAKRQCAFGLYKVFSFINAVPILGYVHNMTEVEPIVAEIWKRGGEGVMLNVASAPYEIKRSKQLLKVKHTEEHVLTVVDLLEGSGKYEDALGALVVDYKGTHVGVGSGFTDDQRSFIWNNKPLFVGRKVEVETFGESTNAQGIVSLNCPIFKRFVGEEE